MKSKKVILPFIKVKDLKSVSSLLSPRNIIVPMLLSSILAQIAEDLKNIVPSKELQQVLSIKFYLKTISLGYSTIDLSIVNAISKTLGPELEVLSILNVRERIKYLQKLKENISKEKKPSKINIKPQMISNSTQLLSHRKGLAFQFRAMLSAISIFSPHAIVFGVPVNSITLDLILNSSKCFWKLLGQSEEEFDFLLQKESISLLNKFPLNSFFNEPKSDTDLVKILFYFELKSLTDFQGKLIFFNDFIILKDETNLTLLEKELSFLERKLPQFPSDNFNIVNSHLKDVIIRAALDQRRLQNLKLENIFKRSEKKYLNKNRLEVNILKNFTFKKNLT